MSKLQTALQKTHDLIEKNRPQTMDELIGLVNTYGYLADYGIQYHIVGYMGYIQGVKISVIARKVHHYLPKADKVYSAYGFKNYLASGWKIETLDELPK